MKRVVISRLGIVSCLGNDQTTVSDALRHSRSGISFREDYAEMGFRSHISGRPEIDLAEKIFGGVNRLTINTHYAIGNAHNQLALNHAF